MFSMGVIITLKRGKNWGLAGEKKVLDITREWPSKDQPYPTKSYSLLLI
jgi:hypothetical protein